jgi:predicted regulator of Ras-like GTPase activity (Roadblock/LC7/MglB family)
MKEARYISTLIIMAILLIVYDVLYQSFNFTTLSSLIVVLSLFGIWMVLQVVVIRLMQKPSATEPEIKDKKQDEPADVAVPADPDNTYIWEPSGPELATKILRRVKLTHPATPEQNKSIIDSIPRHKQLTPKARTQVKKIVSELCEVSGIRSASIISTRGDVLVSVPEIAAPSTNMAALTVSIFALSLRIMNQFGSSKLEQIIVDGSNGLVYFQSAGEETYIMATVGEEMSRGSVVQEVQRTAKLVAAAIAAQ